MIINSINFDFSKITNESLITAVAGYVIVFFSLVMLFIIFSNMPRIVRMDVKSLFRKRDKKTDKSKGSTHFDTSGEVNAAIGTALYLYFNEIHDEESNIITMKKISKRYSPWSSKIYGLRNNPQRQGKW